MLGPLAICRLDGHVLARIRSGEGLVGLMLSAAVWMLVGAGFYGLCMGAWRSPHQGLYAALKLPLLLCILVVSTAVANAVFAGLTASGLRFQQTLACSVLSLSILAITIASTTPVACLLALCAPRFGEALVATEGARTESAVAVAEALLAYHVLVLGASGLICLARLRHLLASLVGSPRQAQELFWLWLGVQGFAGTQVSWILRPYLGKPNLAVQPLRADAFSGSFLEEVMRWFL